MPNSPRPGVKPRQVRVPDELWEAAQAAAAERDETVSQVIRRALDEYAYGESRGWFGRSKPDSAKQ